MKRLALIVIATVALVVTSTVDADACHRRRRCCRPVVRRCCCNHNNCCGATMTAPVMSYSAPAAVAAPVYESAAPAADCGCNGGAVMNSMEPTPIQGDVIYDGGVVDGGYVEGAVVEGDAVMEAPAVDAVPTAPAEASDEGEN